MRFRLAFLIASLLIFPTFASTPPTASDDDDDALFRPVTGMYAGVPLAQLLKLKADREQQLQQFDTLIGKAKAEQMKALLETSQTERKVATVLSWSAKLGTFGSGVVQALTTALGAPPVAHYVTAAFNALTPASMHLSEYFNRDAASIEKQAVKREADTFKDLQTINAQITQLQPAQPVPVAPPKSQARYTLLKDVATAPIPMTPVPSDPTEPEDGLFHAAPGDYVNLPLPELMKLAANDVAELDQYEALIGKARAAEMKQMLAQGENERTAATVMSWSAKGLTMAAAGTSAMVTALTGPGWILYIVAGANIASSVAMHLSEYLVEDARDTDRKVIQRQADTFKDYQTIIAQIKLVQGASPAPQPPQGIATVKAMEPHVGGGDVILDMTGAPDDKGKAELGKANPAGLNTSVKKKKKKKPEGGDIPLNVIAPQQPTGTTAAAAPVASQLEPVPAPTATTSAGGK